MKADSTWAAIDASKKDVELTENALLMNTISDQNDFLQEHIDELNNRRWHIIEMLADIRYQQSMKNFTSMSFIDFSPLVCLFEDINNGENIDD